MDKLVHDILKLSQNSKDKVEQILAFVRKTMKPFKKIFSVLQSGEKIYLMVNRQGVGPLNTNDYGKFFLFHFTVDDEWEKYYALVKVAEIDLNLMPVFKDKESLLLRIDSGCETGQRFHDNTCECNEQLNEAMQMLNAKGEGLILSIPNQDGRGKGLQWKLATLELQDELGLNTVQAAEIVAHLNEEIIITTDEIVNRIDDRTYSGAIAILKFFGIETTTKINLATNNPEKKTVFADNGYTIENVPVIIEPTEQTKKHLEAKQNHLGHALFL